MSVISESEMLVMKCIWSAGKAISSKEIVSLMKNQFGKDYKHTTVCTFLTRLKQKKFVDFTIHGKVHLYFPLVSEKDYLSGQLSDFKELWFDGSVKNLIAAFCEDEKLSTEEIAEIRKLINELDE